MTNDVRQDQNLVTQGRFLDLTGMKDIDLFILIEDGKMPVVKRNGAHLIDLNHPMAKCYLPENKKDLF